MASEIYKYLSVDYPKHFGKAVPLKFPLRVEYTSAKFFEIKDKGTGIIQKAGGGVSVFENHDGKRVEIIDFEKYINDFRKGKACEGGRCDFVLSSADGFDFLILNELTMTKSEYLHGFVQPTTGIPRIGKMEYARDYQLPETIDKLNHAKGLLPKYKHKTALFSYRLPDGGARNAATISMGIFQKPVQNVSNITMHQSLMEGFVFEQRVYPQAYRIP